MSTSNSTNHPTLSQQAIENFNTDGFLVVDNVLTPVEVEQIREICELPGIAASADALANSETGIHLLNLTVKHPALLALARDRRLVDRLTPLLGPDIELQHSKLAVKPLTAGKGAFGWHQDLAYFPHTNSSLIAVMVMLDDATPDNGCMYMVRGSHKLGYLSHQKDGYFAGCQETHLWEAPDAPVVAITPRAGGISLHHGLTLHGSPPNRSGKPRRGLVFQYRAADAYQLADDIFEDTGLLVAGQASTKVRLDSVVIQLPVFRQRWGGASFGDCYHQRGSWAELMNRLHAAQPNT